MGKNINRPSIIKNNEGLFQLIDDTQHTLQTKTAQRGLRIFDPYFQDSSQLTFKPDLTYVQLLELIDSVNFLWVTFQRACFSAFCNCYIYF